MKDKIKIIYLVLPFLFSLLVHLMFVYGNWELNPGNWSEYSRSMSAISMFGAFMGGLLISYVSIYDKKTI